MAWIEDQVYSFTLARLLEGFLRIDSLTVNGINMIVGGVDQGVTPLIHPGSSVSVSMVVSNQGKLVDDFQIKVLKDGAAYATSPTISALAIGATASYSPAAFTMPDANVAMGISCYHYEEETVATIIVAQDGSGHTTDIQTGINMLPATGGVVYIKEGTYNIDTTITIHSSNVALMGAGFATIIFLLANSNTDIITAGDGVNSYEGVVIESLQIDGNRANQGLSVNQAAIKLEVTKSLVNRCYIHDSYTSGIYLTQSNDCIASNNICNSNGAAGINMARTANSIVSNNQCNDNGLNGISLWDTSVGARVSNNQCNGNPSKGIRVANSANCVIEGNICTDNGTGGASEGGISLENADESIAIGNRCEGNNVNGIYISVATDSSLIVDNILLGNTIAINDLGTNTQIGNNIIS